MWDVDFRTASLDEISSRFFANGAVLLRGFVKLDELNALIKATNDQYLGVSEDHIFDRDFLARGMPHFHEFVFEEKHKALLLELFAGGRYRVSAAAATRRIDSSGRNGQWQAPLAPHLDAFFHSLAFTVNFWVPFRDCGVDAPSLGVVEASFSEIVRFTGYDGNTQLCGMDQKVGEWNFAHFDRSMRMLAASDPAATANFRRVFANRLWTPTYALGDAMLLSNWTMHFTHASPEMKARRGNVELRFESDQRLREHLPHRAAALGGVNR